MDVAVGGETRRYSPESLSGRIRKLEGRERRRLEEEEELEVLRAAQAAVRRPLELLEHRQREWLSLWELCQSQRYGQGMTMGTLVHSEVWNNLEKLQYEGHEKRRAFRVILGIDEIFRGHARKMEERRGDGK